MRVLAPYTKIMERIEIKDMVTLRAYALSLVKNFLTINGIYADESLAAAMRFESYIKGNAELPEYNSPMDSAKLWSDILDKINKPCESLNLFWIDADKELKPALNIQVLVMCKDSKYPQFGEYLGEDYWAVEKADVIHRTKDGEVTVVAWMPIPEYKPSV